MQTYSVHLSVYACSIIKVTFLYTGNHNRHDNSVPRLKSLHCAVTCSYFCGVHNEVVFKNLNKFFKFGPNSNEVIVVIYIIVFECN